MKPGQCMVALLMALVAGEVYPSCLEKDVVLRHAGAHGIFVDVSPYGSSGCWESGCRSSDKFNSREAGVCARACSEIQECTHWSFGSQDGTTSCFLRKSDGGRENADDFVSAAKACAPPDIPDAWLAMLTSDLPGLKVCDAGKSEICPDIARAMNTWRFAIAALKRATDGVLDPASMKYVKHIAENTDAFMLQISAENFPVIAGNNRQVFEALRPWMSEQPVGDVDASDLSLPAPLRGELCSASSCFE